VARLGSLSSVLGTRSYYEPNRPVTAKGSFLERSLVIVTQICRANFLVGSARREIDGSAVTRHQLAETLGLKIERVFLAETRLLRIT
jgi:hypothetical protein